MNPHDSDIIFSVSFRFLSEDCEGSRFCSVGHWFEGEHFFLSRMLPLLLLRVDVAVERYAC